MERSDLNELVMKWRKERALKYQARLMAKNGGKPLPDNIDKILGLVGSGSTKQLSFRTTIRPIATPPPSTPQNLDLPIYSTPSTPHLRKSFSESGLSIRRESAITKSRLSSINIIKGLENWFKTRGKKQELLRLKKSAIEISRATVTKNNESDSNSIESSVMQAVVDLDRLHIDSNEPSSIENKDNPEEKKPLEFYLDLLNDTFNLLKMGYPVKHVAKIFDKIVDNYWDLNDHPVFYEILSLLKQSDNLNNFNFEKNELLNTAVENLKERLKIIDLDMESMISDDKENVGGEYNVPSFSVQFAVLESKKPDAEQKFAVTPVRRSTRPCAVTPGSVKCVRTLSELSPTVSNNFRFKPNKFLKF